MTVLIWDFFLAHSSTDLDAAMKLYELLTPYARVFLDRCCLKYGDDWDQELARAQLASRITVVLVSSHTDRAYYEREEIATALEMARSGIRNHRVVPLYLSAVQNVPYGLRAKHAIYINHMDDLVYTSHELLGLLNNHQISNSTTALPKLMPVRPSEVEKKESRTISSARTDIAFTLRNRHYVRLEVQGHWLRLSEDYTLTIDGKEVLRGTMKHLTIFSQTIEKTFPIEDVECLIAIHERNGYKIIVGGIEIS